MHTDGSSFLRRARVFIQALSANEYPNASVIMRIDGCSRSTAMRVIDRLRYEFAVPFGFDEARRGYFLRDSSYRFSTLPPGTDELTALLLMRDMARLVGSKDLYEKADSLWSNIVQGNPRLEQDLRRLVSYFSSESSVVVKLSELRILDLLSVASRGDSVSLRYKSPWREGEAKVFRGQVLRVHLSDGLVYLLFHSESGREFVLNASFIEGFEVLDTSVSLPYISDVAQRAHNWLEGFGVWAGAAVETVEVRIRPPGAHYYASQSWHEDQEDKWEEGHLVRTFPAIPSPELARRLLSLGRYLAAVKPTSIAALLEDDIASLAALVDRSP